MAATLEGYCLVWGTRSDTRYDWFEEEWYYVVIDPDTIDLDEFSFALFNHNWLGLPLGATDAATFRFEIDDFGLRVEIDLPDTTLGQDIEELVRRGDVRGMSAEVWPLTTEESLVDGVREIRMKSIAVTEATVTHIPAVPAARVRILGDESVSLRGDDEPVVETGFRPAA